MSLINPYCTVAQVQAELRNDDSALTTEIEEAINQASRWIDDWKGRDWLLHNHSVTALELDKHDSWVFLNEVLYLPFTPIITLTSVTVAGELWVAGTDYVVKDGATPNARLVAVDGHWPLVCPPDNISIVGQFGYAQASAAAVPTGLPLHVNKAAILIAAAFSGHNQKEVIGLDGAKSTVIDKAIPKTAMALLGSPKIVL